MNTPFLLARRRQPRGIAVMMVLAAMIFLAATIVGMTALFAHEVTRTRAALAETQLRQLLLAGATAAQNELTAVGTAERTVPLATPVEGAALTLHLAGTAQEATVRVAGTWRGFVASQNLTFARNPAGNWQLADTRLDQTAGQ